MFRWAVVFGFWIAEHVCSIFGGIGCGSLSGSFLLSLKVRNLGVLKNRMFSLN